MPVVIGGFISRHVYDNELKTVHEIKSKTACRFLHVERSQEIKQGNSWTVCHSPLTVTTRLLTLHQNKQEIDVIIKLSRRFFDKKKAYKIITPYDAQRTAIERELKSAELPWENKCFNVDSFQGE